MKNRTYVQEFMDGQPHIVYNYNHHDDLVSYTIPVYVMQQIIDKLQEIPYTKPEENKSGAI